MFSVEIKQADSSSEARLVRRQIIRIGANQNCHVVVPQLASAGYYLQVEKDLGNRFKVVPLGNVGDRRPKSYELNATLNVEDLEISITAVDYDLIIRENESLDKGVVRVLKQAALKSISDFPALLVRSENRFVYSLALGVPVYLGRSDDNDIVLDASDISSRHCRFGHDGENFWIEDLGSTNGTYLERQQISGRVNLKSGVPVVLGLKTTLLGVTNLTELEQATQIKSEAIAKPIDRKFPVIISASEIARPAKLVLPVDSIISIGRDPSNEIWLGIPHVSRKHCKLQLHPDGSVEIEDSSTNGTAYLGGILKNGETVRIKDPQILNFGEDINLAICFDESQEKKFFEAKGDPSAFQRETSTHLAGVSRATTTLDRSTVESVKNISQVVRETTINDQVINFFSGLSPVTKMLFVGVGISLVLLIILIMMVLWSVLR